MKYLLVITSFFGLTAVVLGAFSAHALKETLSSEQLNSFETAVRYQFYHVFVLLIINLHSVFSLRQKKWLSTFFILGILFFSGSIYTIQLTTIAAKKIWFTTPLGGVFFVIGWLMLIFYFFKCNLKKYT